MKRRRSLRWALMALCASFSVTAAWAQTVTVPPFVVNDPAALPPQIPNLAAGSDGTLLFVWQEVPAVGYGGKIFTRHFSAAGVALGGRNVIYDLYGLKPATPVVADGTGGYLLVHSESFPVRYRLSSEGSRIGEPLRLDDQPMQNAQNTTDIRMQMLPSGPLIQYRLYSGLLRLRSLDFTGTPQGPSFASGSTLDDLGLTALSDGAFATLARTVQQNPARYNQIFRVYDTPSSPRIPWTDFTPYLASQIKGDLDGGFVLTGGLDRDVWVARFDGNGNPTAPPFIVDSEPAPYTPDPVVEFDAQGNMLVAWSSRGTFLSDYGPLRVRAYDRNNNPLGPSVTVADTSAHVSAVRLPNDDFAFSWIGAADLTGKQDFLGAVVTLCPGGSATCGDGTVDPVCEQCDDGGSNSDATPGSCRSSCRRAACGDSVIDPGEECDDGNRFGDDGCDQLCQIETCGNGRREASESCDDANLVSGDGCDANCTLTGCNNGVVTAGEECDDGNFIAADGCSALCRFEVCGNHVRDPGELCDDGNLIPGDGCDADCTPTACGNGNLTDLEECDDGNVDSGDGCSSTCLVEDCGNGRVEGLEQCDDGNNVDDDGCQANCIAASLVDTVAIVLRTQKVNLGTGDLTNKKVRVKLADVRPNGNRNIRVSVSDGTCPPGTIASPPDLDPVSAGTQDSGTIHPGEKLRLKMTLAFHRADFTFGDRNTPVRCEASLTVHTPTGAIDKVTSNDTISIPIDVYDRTAPEIGPAEFYVRPLKLLKLSIPASIVSVTKEVAVRVSGATATTALSIVDGNCPAGTASVSHPLENGVGRISIRVSRAFFQTAANSPDRCTAVVTATDVVDGEPSNNSAPVVVDVFDDNDL